MGFHSDPSDLVREEMEERGALAPAAGTRPKKKRPPRQQSSTPARAKRPTAPEGVSAHAEDWVQRGNAIGFEFPYDVNYFALELDKKIQRDKRFRMLFDRGEDDKVRRWVDKMIERWWEEYVEEVVTARNAKDYFLDTDWVDCQEYARSCLRAAYLKEHGREVQAPQYPQQQEFQEELREIEKKGVTRRFVERVDLDAAPPQLDESGRERLRSWRDRRKGSK